MTDPCRVMFSAPSTVIHALSRGTRMGWRRGQPRVGTGRVEATPRPRATPVARLISFRRTHSCVRPRMVLSFRSSVTRRRWACIAKRPFVRFRRGVIFMGSSSLTSRVARRRRMRPAARPARRRTATQLASPPCASCPDHHCLSDDAYPPGDGRGGSSSPSRRPPGVRFKRRPRMSSRPATISRACTGALSRRAPPPIVGSWTRSAGCSSMREEAQIRQWFKGAMHACGTYGVHSVTFARGVGVGNAARGREPRGQRRTCRSSRGQW